VASSAVGISGRLGRPGAGLRYDASHVQALRQPDPAPARRCAAQQPDPARGARRHTDREDHRTLGLPERLVHLVLVNGVYVPPAERLSYVPKDGDVGWRSGRRSRRVMTAPGSPRSRFQEGLRPLASGPAWPEPPNARPLPARVRARDGCTERELRAWLPVRAAIATSPGASVAPRSHSATHGVRCLASPRSAPHCADRAAAPAGALRGGAHRRSRVAALHAPLRPLYAARRGDRSRRAPEPLAQVRAPCRAIGAAQSRASKGWVPS